MPSDQLAFMRKMVEGGSRDIIPPSQEEIKQWKACYLSYWNANFSTKKGRELPLEFCVKNPRPDEIMDAFRSLQIIAIFEGGKQRPSDSLNLGRFKFQLTDANGNYLNEKYKTKREVLRLVGKHIAQSDVRKNPITCAKKELEGVFDFDAEMGKIESAMNQVHGPSAGQAEQQAQSKIK